MKGAILTASGRGEAVFSLRPSLIWGKAVQLYGQIGNLNQLLQSGSGSQSLYASRAIAYENRYVPRGPPSEVPIGTCLLQS